MAIELSKNEASGNTDDDGHDNTDVDDGSSFATGTLGNISHDIT